MLNDDNSTISDILTDNVTEPVAKNPTNQKIPYLAGMNSTISNSFSPNAIDSLLEKEMLFNKTEPWNKLDKTVKTQKLIAYAEKYGSVTLKGEIQNLFDKDYEYAQGYPMQGRSFFLGLRYDF